MARVTYGPYITELAGSIGGITFQKNTSGNIARLKPNMPVNPTPPQADQQYKLSSLVAMWPSLSSSDKNSWNALAAAHDHVTPWGETKTLNGYQWFLSSNLNILTAGGTVLHTAPGFVPLDPPDPFTLQATSSYLRAHWPYSVSVDPYAFFIYLTAPLRQASLKLRRSLFLADVNTTFDGTDLVLTSLFESLFNVTWSTFYAAADCSLICRILFADPATGFTSSFTSGIVKVG